MRKKFPGYYRPSENEFKKIWDKGLFVFDTNVLLDLYRYSDETVETLLKIMNLIKDRIWIPFQVSKEYHRNLNSIISEQVKKYDNSIRTLSDFKKQIEEKRSHPFLEQDFKTEIDEFCNKFDNILKNKQKEIKKLILSNPVKEKLADLLDDKIGDQLPNDKISDIYIEGEKRYKENIPPGYLDKKKSAPEKFGDLIIWKEILKKNKELEQPILFITRDTKDDWFTNEMGLTISPRPELIAEFKKVKNNLFYCYTTSSFLTYANEYLNVEIDKKSINEIEEILAKFGELNEVDSFQIEQLLNEDYILPEENENTEQFENEDNSFSIDENNEGEIID